MDVLMITLLLLLLVLVLVFWLYLQTLVRRQEGALDDHMDRLSDQLTYHLSALTENQQVQQQSLYKEMTDLRRELYQQLLELREVLHQGILDTRQVTDQRLKELQDSNEKRLEEMRQTVEEKLEKTLQSRLQLSFETVSKQLESVNQGLGQMQHLAKDVGDLSKTLSNSKTRGIMGEILLGNILEDILTPNQYEREIATIPNSSDRVEYAVKLPGQSPDQMVYLPVDSKFPLADYYRLEEAYESGHREEIDRSRKALLTQLRAFAKDISRKYIQAPYTTNFAILFVPTEGLYSEIVRNPAFFDDLRRQERILVAGPSTLSALLNSLSIGFKTLQIQRSAQDIEKVLGSVKSEFGKFGGILQKTQKQLQQASSNLDKLLITRSNAIERALRNIEVYEGEDATQLLSLPIENEEIHED